MTIPYVCTLPGISLKGLKQTLLGLHPWGTPHSV